MNTSLHAFMPVLRFPILTLRSIASAPYDSKAHHNGATSRIAILTAVFCLLATPALAQDASFEGLGFLSGWGLSRAHGVSADGSVVVGRTSSDQGLQAFRWEDGKMEGLGVLPGGMFSFSVAWAASADGSVVVGYGDSAEGGEEGFEAFRWTAAGGMEGLGDFAESGSYMSEATAVSADGSVIVGVSHTLGEAVIWRNGNMERLAEGIPARATGVSADGSVVVGTTWEGEFENQQAFRWTEDDGMALLGAPSGGFSVATAVSADGAVVVGYHVDPDHISSLEQAFRWTEAEGMVLIGNLSPTTPTSYAYAVSDDGSVVVGRSHTGAFEEGFTPFIWRESDGMRNLREVLEDDYDLDLTGWHLQNAWGVSADGTVIIGNSTLSPSFIEEAWRAVLPRSSTNEPTSETLTTTLSAPSPNPVRGTAAFILTIDREQHVTVEVFDVMGRRVQTLYEGSATRTETRLTLDASSLSSGMYIIRAVGEDFVDTRRVTVIR